MPICDKKHPLALPSPHTASRKNRAENPAHVSGVISSSRISPRTRPRAKARLLTSGTVCVHRTPGTLHRRPAGGFGNPDLPYWLFLTDKRSRPCRPTTAPTTPQSLTTNERGTTWAGALGGDEAPETSRAENHRRNDQLLLLRLLRPTAGPSLFLLSPPPRTFTPMHDRAREVAKLKPARGF